MSHWFESVTSVLSFLNLRFFVCFVVDLCDQFHVFYTVFCFLSSVAHFYWKCQRCWFLFAFRFALTLEEWPMRMKFATTKQAKLASWWRCHAGDLGTSPRKLVPAPDRTSAVSRWCCAPKPARPDGDADADRVRPRRRCSSDWWTSARRFRCGTFSYPVSVWNSQSALGWRALL